MKKAMALGIMALILGIASWVDAYTYSVSGDYGIFNNDSSSDAIVDLVLWYGNGGGHYEYSNDGSSWDAIINSGDGQAARFTVGNNGSFWLKFVGGNNAEKDLNAWNISDQNAPYWFAFNNGSWSNGSDPYGCVAVIKGSAVPVPAAVWLFGSGILGLAGIRRKLKK
ncbi:exported hypothetical protein [Desulfamplus magnetovallimortis]|uniref:PEP-CTERM protein-sorting domain-containing protein n=1 Tax=Desulfamplus magnetovallimortis TaxID=1246637 RepID=A0A1W1HFH9_9BACT|nr:VPLPA-CTERM sorting domain-containing protein [Desulfamplus magnetovallimortis]SLM31158.1 exported hypothetical protein [Desulfamplus magnetovallimortis]